jgi:hypothetical protein
MNGLFVVSTIVVNRAFCCFNQSLVRSGLASEKVNHYENHTVLLKQQITPFTTNVETTTKNIHHQD